VYTFSAADGESAAAAGLQHKCSLSAPPEAPLFLLVHGRAGNYEVMSAFKSCLPPGCNVLLPQAPKPEVQGGFSWWTVDEDMSYRERAAAAADTVCDFLARAKEHYALRPRAIIAYGFSQGCALLSLVVQKDARLLNGAALLAGFVIEREIKARPPFPKVFIGHGTEDRVVFVANARKGAEYLKRSGYEVLYFEDPVSHKIGSVAMRELKAWSARLASGEGA
jgi:phospholipase/carboxylesterase